ncbi:MAG: LolA family protein [Phycisphaerae bacterium]
MKSLSADWDALKDVKTLEAHFVCEKNLAALETPLHSEGRVWIRKGEDAKEGAVRFSTEKPYVSELILADGKVYARSQHETEWTKTGQASRPGLTAVMSQLGGWSTGNAAKISDMYTVSRGSAVPPMPDASTAASPGVDVFILTTANKDLAKAVKQVTIAVDRAAHTLRFVEILTQQGDATRYWFYDVHTNVTLPADIFKPDGQLLPPEDHKQ